MAKKNIAIIGGGGAGSVAAWALNKVHNVTIFEKEPVLGGHAYTENLKLGKSSLKLDLAVEYFSERQAPNLCQLLDHFKIDTYVAPLSFGAYFEHQNKDFWSNTHIKGNTWDKIKNECSKFQYQMNHLMHLYNDETKRLTLGQFLKREGYSKDFIHKALLPLLTTFSSGNSPTLDYSLTFCAISFTTGLLSFFHPTYWRKSSNGITSYLDKISKLLGKNIKLSTPVKKVIRSSNGVTIITDKKEEFKFDEVVFATHADITLSLLENPTEMEQKILSKFEYTDIECVLHSDPAYYIKEFGRDVYCYYISKSKKDFSGSLTRIENYLDPYRDIKKEVFVTFDPKFKIEEKYVYSRKQWKIPKLRPSDMLNKQQIKHLQGKDHTWFCGTDTSFTGHEGAIVSGLVIANLLGGEYPFKRNNWAKVQFDIVKNIMGVYSSSEAISNKLNTIIHFIAKKLGLHKSQISKAFLDFYV